MSDHRFAPRAAASLLAAAMALASSLPGAAQPAPQAADLFDFWLGDWQVTWKNADGTTGRARNHVQRILDGQVIEEQFEGVPDGSPHVLRGHSLSVLQKSTGLWRQAWADNEGSYFDFTGSVDGERRVFATSLVADGDKVKGQRMVFHDIARDGFTWDWEGTTDGGKTWKLLWQLHYRR
jgi:hypothetical protein